MKSSNSGNVQESVLIPHFPSLGWFMHRKMCLEWMSPEAQICLS